MKIINDTEMYEFFSRWSEKSDKLLSIKEQNELSLADKHVFLTRSTKPNYEAMQKNLSMIFGKSSNIEEQICLFDEVLEFLQNVVQVDGADRLFSKHFYDIEWNMFLEADFEKNEMKIYRDHFVHQIRNAYLGYYLIWDELGFISIIEDVINKYESTGFSEFINIFKKKELRKNDQNDFIRKVIRKTWFLSSLFHDIGYPLSYHQRYSARIDRYMPYLRVLDNRKQLNFVEVSALLADTYLFKMVEYDELKTKYEDFDHGMLSSLCLLLNYYHTGTIHRLSNLDRCSIELAAYAIYVHTREYSIHDKEEKHVRPVFVEDPISYLLRLCDDLQEWGRMYFIVEENSNTLICNKCKKTVVKSKNSNKNTSGDEIEIYVCKCPDETKKCFSKISPFNYRKINLVEVCSQLKVTVINKSIVFELDYDLVKLLEVLSLDKQYPYFRNKELSKLKKILTDQAMLPNIEIKYFLSENHFEIKTEILRRHIQSHISSAVGEDLEILSGEYLIKNKSKLLELINININNDGDQAVHQLLQEEIDKIINYLENKPQVYADNGEAYLENIYLYKLINEFKEKKYI